MRESAFARAAWQESGGPAVPPSSDERVRALEEERERLLERLVHLERISQLGLMTAGLAHDLANQITGVMGAAELALMHDGADAAELREGLSGVLAHGGRMHETLEAFLSFARRREHRVRTFAVSELTEVAQRLVHPAARSEGVVLLQSVATTAHVRADRLLLEQVIVNLLLNAIRAAARGGGRVALSAVDGKPGRVWIAVRDTGTGIPAAVRARLFEPFVTGNADSGGHGLGLFVAREIIQRYDGRIEVESSPLGTRIEIDLPVAPPAG